jgi:hypothetical protein
MQQAVVVPRHYSPDGAVTTANRPQTDRTKAIVATNDSSVQSVENEPHWTLQKQENTEIYICIYASGQT